MMICVIIGSVLELFLKVENICVGMLYGLYCLCLFFVIVWEFGGMLFYSFGILFGILKILLSVEELGVVIEKYMDNICLNF